MSTLSSPGIGSGLDVRGIVTSLVESERTPFNARITEQQGKATEKITSFGRLVSATTAFQDAAKKLNNASLFEVNSITGSSDYLSSTVSSKAVQGRYTVEVRSLAQGQKLASKAYAKDDKVGEGTMSITVKDKKLDIKLDGTETLSQLKDKINKDKANPGLFASIITDDQGQRLVLNAKNVGVDNTISISVTDKDGNNTDKSGLSAFVYTPDTIDSSGRTAQLGSFNANSDVVGDGTLTINAGTKSFTTNTNGLTLEQLKDKINTDATGAGANLTASIVTNKEGKQQLYLQAATGEKVTVSANDADNNNTDASGISTFAFNPNTDAKTKGGVTAVGTSNLTQTQAASDAQIVIDGTSVVTQSSNVFKDAIEGVTFTAKKVNKVGENTNVSIQQDTSQVGSALADFAAAYNTFLETTQTLGRINTDSSIVGALAGDSLLRGLVSQVRNIISETINGSGSVNSLASLGLTTNRQGLLEVNEALLGSQVKNNFDDVKTLFTGNDSVGKKLTTALGSYTGGSGTIQAKIDGYKTTIKRLDTETTEFNKKMESLEARLYAQYNAMDLQVAQLNSTSGFLTNQLANLPGVVRRSNGNQR